VIHQDPELANHYRRNGMTRDFSWEKTAREYLEFFEQFMKR
jgi:glycogen synthase